MLNVEDLIYDRTACYCPDIEAHFHYPGHADLNIIDGLWNASYRTIMLGTKVEYKYCNWFSHKKYFQINTEIYGSKSLSILLIL